MNKKKGGGFETYAILKKVVGMKFRDYGVQSCFLTRISFIAGCLTFPVTDVTRRCFGSVDREDGARELASRDTWSRDLTVAVEGLERLHHVDRYWPASLRKSTDDFGPSVVYRCQVPENVGFVSGSATGWGLPDEPISICKFFRILGFGFCFEKRGSLFEFF